MQSVVIVRSRQRRNLVAGFTLVELLVVIAIIAILVGLTLAAATAAMSMAARSRARGEVQAISTALESYKNDNGAYPTASGLLTNSAASPYNSSTVDGSTVAYQTNSATVYQALAGVTNFGDIPVSGTKVYMAFKANQLGNYSSSATSPVYIQDPWGYSYGYSTGSASGAAVTNYPYNGSGFYDLWSTGGLIAPAATNSSAWISNWSN